MKTPENVRKHPVKSAILLIIACGLLYGAVFTVVEAFRLNRLSSDLDALARSYQAVEGVAVERSRGCGSPGGKYGPGISKSCSDSVLVTTQAHEIAAMARTFKLLRASLENTNQYEIDGLRELQDEPVVAGSFGFGGYKHKASGRGCSTGYRQLDDGRGEMRLTCRAAPWYSTKLGINRPGF